MTLPLPLLRHFDPDASNPGTGNIYVLADEVTFEKLALPCTPTTTLFAPITVHPLLRSALHQHVISTFSTRSGSCWRGLFSERVTGWEQMWMTVRSLKRLAINVRVDVRQTFNILVCALGFVHIEADNNGIWSAYDILMFPDWVLVGGTFLEDGIEQGYPEDFVQTYCFYAQDTRRDDSDDELLAGSPTPSVASSDASSTGHITANPEDKVNVREALVRILSSNKTSKGVLKGIREYFISDGPHDLSRFEMELIARATGLFCYSATASSAEVFEQDVIQGYVTGDTMATFLRFLNNEVDKDDRVNKIIKKDFDKKPTIVPGMIPKTLHMDMTHISRYPFQGSVKVLTSTIQSIIGLLIQLKMSVDKPNDYAAIEQNVNKVIEFTNIDDGPKNMALAYDLAVHMNIDLDIFEQKIFRVLDINKWNTFSQAEEYEYDLREGEFLAGEEAEGLYGDGGRAPVALQ